MVISLASTVPETYDIAQKEISELFLIEEVKPRLLITPASDY